VFVSDESHLGRDMVAKLMFANLCTVKRVLLVLDGRVGDLSDSTTLLQTRDLAGVLALSRSAVAETAYLRMTFRPAKSSPAMG